MQKPDWFNLQSYAEFGNKNLADSAMRNLWAEALTVRQFAFRVIRRSTLGDRAPGATIDPMQNQNLEARHDYLVARAIYQAIKRDPVRPDYKKFIEAIPDIPGARKPHAFISFKSRLNPRAIFDQMPNVTPEAKECAQRHISPLTTIELRRIIDDNQFGQDLCLDDVYYAKIDASAAFPRSYLSVNLKGRDDELIKEFAAFLRSVRKRSECAFPYDGIAATMKDWYERHVLAYFDLRYLHSHFMGYDIAKKPNRPADMVEIIEQEKHRISMRSSGAIDDESKQLRTHAARHEQVGRLEKTLKEDILNPDTPQRLSV